MRIMDCVLLLFQRRLNTVEKDPERVCQTFVEQIIEGELDCRRSCTSWPEPVAAAQFLKNDQERCMKLCLLTVDVIIAESAVLSQLYDSIDVVHVYS